MKENKFFQIYFDHLFNQKYYINTDLRINVKEIDNNMKTAQPNQLRATFVARFFIFLGHFFLIIEKKYCSAWTNKGRYIFCFLIFIAFKLLYNVLGLV